MLCLVYAEMEKYMWKQKMVDPVHSSFLCKIYTFDKVYVGESAQADLSDFPMMIWKSYRPSPLGPPLCVVEDCYNQWSYFDECLVFSAKNISICDLMWVCYLTFTKKWNPWLNCRCNRSIVWWIPKIKHLSEQVSSCQDKSAWKSLSACLVLKKKKKRCTSVTWVWHWYLKYDPVVSFCQKFFFFFAWMFSRGCEQIEKRGFQFQFLNILWCLKHTNCKVPVFTHDISVFHITKQEGHSEERIPPPRSGSSPKSNQFIPVTNPTFPSSFVWICP